MAAAPGTLRQRVVAGFGANSVGMALGIGMQLASLPLFLAVWDLHTYGLWLMISALPAYLTMADAGMVTAAGNRMTMALGSGRLDEARRVFHSAQAFVLALCTALALLMLPLALWSPWPPGAGADLRLALAALGLGVLAAFVGGLAEQWFRATHRYAQGTLLAHAARLAEWGGGIAGLYLHGSFAAVAAGALLGRLAGTLVSMALARRGNDDLAWGLRGADWVCVRELLRPAAGFLAFPLANALSLQGVTLLVGMLLGPVAVAVFNTYRMLARIAVQASGLLSHALWPEFSRLHGQGEAQALARLARRASGATALLALLLGAGLYLFAPALLAVWTRGEIGFDAPVFALLMVYAVIAGLWHVPRVLLMAANGHGVLALWALASALLCLGLSRWLGGEHALVGVALGILLAEALLALVCLWLARSGLWPRPAAAVPLREALR